MRWETTYRFFEETIKAGGYNSGLTAQDNAMVQTRQQRQQQRQTEPVPTTFEPLQQPNKRQRKLPTQPRPPPPPQCPTPTSEHPMRRFARMVSNKPRAFTVIVLAVCLLAYLGSCAWTIVTQNPIFLVTKTVIVPKLDEDGRFVPETVYQTHTIQATNLGW
ncbi:hypothetical protein AC578_1119 [Pseudocercospora eumusae]|uniref:Uncharacterized protein n=1 Tax=Pseudocercospora eumusae TaxID=321146 RepID=A0A139GXJ5_9PEZI|nr:hypothetical protein AC578_1119 [Pseudocercospora eumusae]